VNRSACDCVLLFVCLAFYCFWHYARCKSKVDLLTLHMTHYCTWTVQFNLPHSGASQCHTPHIRYRPFFVGVLIPTLGSCTLVTHDHKRCLFLSTLCRRVESLASAVQRIPPIAEYWSTRARDANSYDTISTSGNRGVAEGVAREAKATPIPTKKNYKANTNYSTLQHSHCTQLHYELQ